MRNSEAVDHRWSALSITDMRSKKIILYRHWSRPKLSEKGDTMGLMRLKRTPTVQVVAAA